MSTTEIGAAAVRTRSRSAAGEPIKKRRRTPGISQTVTIIRRRDVDELCRVMHDAMEDRRATAARWGAHPYTRRVWADLPAEQQETIRGAVTAIVGHLVACGAFARPVPPLDGIEVHHE